MAYSNNQVCLSGPLLKDMCFIIRFYRTKAMEVTLAMMEDTEDLVVVERMERLDLLLEGMEQHLDMEHHQEDHQEEE